MKKFNANKCTHLHLHPWTDFYEISGLKIKLINLHGDPVDDCDVRFLEVPNQLIIFVFRSEELFAVSNTSLNNSSDITARTERFIASTFYDH